MASRLLNAAPTCLPAPVVTLPPQSATSARMALAASRVGHFFFVVYNGNNPPPPDDFCPH